MNGLRNKGGSMRRKHRKEMTDEQKEQVIELKNKVDTICMDVIDGISELPKEERFLALGRVINSLVDIAYKPVIINYLKDKGEI